MILKTEPSTMIAVHSLLSGRHTEWLLNLSTTKLGNIVLLHDNYQNPLASTASVSAGCRILGPVVLHTLVSREDCTKIYLCL